MVAQVKWTSAANKALDRAVYQCWKKFGSRIATRFYEQVKSNDKRLAAHPHLGKAEPLLAHKKMAYRSLVVHKHYKIVYYVEDTTIQVVRLWDTRREPAALVRHIK